jgi:hypothetical protein
VNIALAVLGVAGLSGCGLWETDSFVPREAVANGACGSIAADRATDAKAAGQDDPTQRSVFDRTYSDCIAWRQAHGN